MTPTATERRAYRAAIINGAVVFLPPFALILLALMSSSGGSRPVSVSTGRIAVELVEFGLVLVALAALASWRTWVHAVRWQAGLGRGWQGVAEAAACGLLVAVVYLAPGIFRRPTEAPPYVIFYGGAASILGCLVGLILRSTAAVVLRLAKSVAA
jgi:hypothetical protein